MFLTDVKILLRFKTSDCSKDELLLYLERVVRRKILNYCNIDKIPLSHEYIVADIVANYYNLNYSYLDSTEEVVNTLDTKATTNSVGPLKKETIGDYSIEYYELSSDSESSSGSTSSSSSTDVFTSSIDSFINDYKSQLNQIRKLRL